MKTVKLINICPGLETLTQNQQEYLRAADVSVCDERDGIILFQWDDTVYNEEIDTKAVRIARTIEEMFCLDNHKLDFFAEAIIVMPHDAVRVLTCDSDASIKAALGESAPEFESMQAINNWKSVRANLNVRQAFEALNSGRCVFGLPVAIRHGQRIITRDASIKDVKCSSSEIISDKWEIIVPDAAAESRLKEVRTLLKDSDLTEVINGVHKHTLDYMDATQLWLKVSEYVMRKTDNEKIRIIESIIKRKY